MSAPATATPIEDDRWAQPLDELPPRPRRRLLGVGGNTGQIALLGVLLTACGFIGGVLVEKGQAPSSPTAGGTAAGLASRLAALRSGGSAAGSTGSGSSASGGGFGSGAGFTGRFGGGAGTAGGATIGEVAYIEGKTLYVIDAEGNTLKVTTAAAASITKTVKTDVHGIHPGDTVIVRGNKSASGTVSAESVSVNAAIGAGGSGGGLGVLLGR